MINETKSKYHSYLLRVWSGRGGNAWQVMLEHVDTHERRGFTDLESLCAFLQNQIDGDLVILGEREDDG